MAEFNGVYSPSDSQAIIGNRVAQGYGEGTFIEIKRNKDTEFDTKVGAQGEGTFVENKDKSGDVVLSIKQNATEEHAYYRSLLNAKAIFPINVVRVRDGQVEKVTCLQCMVKRAPRKKMTDTEEVYVWEFSVIRIIENDTAG